ncbi:MAG: hypothetical protein HY245_11345 [Rhizobiales bacterium]|nr:hypothetical protein [Hyphomicrobiales bacterium]MBI3673986.1 hypothetical protein [Hyphomicrobiales bacterium]
MPDDLMRYDLLAQQALRGVVREALRHVERAGLPGEHHFYIAFNTKHPGVDIGERLAARYPREMTIVLQHQFWGLTVSDDRFEVELSFDNIPEKLIIPFDAVKGFLDPAVQFGLQFETVPPPAAAAAEKPRPAKPEVVENIEKDENKPDGPAQDDEPKVVSLDSFRKK